MPLILGLELLGKSYNARYDQLLLVWPLQSFGKVQRKPRKATAHVGFAVGMSTLCAMPGHSWRSCLKRLRLCEQVGWGRSQGISRVGEQCQVYGEHRFGTCLFCAGRVGRKLSKVIAAPVSASVPCDSCPDPSRPLPEVSQFSSSMYVLGTV